MHNPQANPMRGRLQQEPGQADMGAPSEQSDAEITRSVDDLQVNRYVHQLTSAEFKRWLEKLGATFEPTKGGHIWVMLNGRRTVLPMHGSRHELKTGTVEAIKKQLGLK